MNRLRGVFNKYAANGQSVPIWNVFGSFALDYVYNLLFGIDKNFMENMDKYAELRETIEYIFDVSKLISTDLMCGYLPVYLFVCLFVCIEL